MYELGQVAGWILIIGFFLYLVSSSRKRNKGVKPDEQDNPASKPSFFSRLIRRTLVIAFVGIVLSGLAAFIAANIDESNRKQAAAAEAARIAADPINAESIYNHVNDERQKASVPRLTMNPKLVQAAADKCKDMNQYKYYDHINPATQQSGYVYAQAALDNDKYVSENLNQGNLPTSMDFVNSWLSSPSHKAAMLDPKYTDTGVAICEPIAFPDKTTMVQLFASFYTPEEIKAAQPAYVPVPSYAPTVCNTYNNLGGYSSTTYCN